MARLSIRKVIYSGRAYSYESPRLGDGLNILQGANGTGKTTFSELIYYGLGGRVEKFQRNSSKRHAEVTSDGENFVQLLVEVSGAQFNVKRFIDRNEVGVEDETGKVEVFAIRRSEATPSTFSDWLLAKLGIAPVTVFSSGDYSGKISFYDLARLIYHDQSPDPSGIFKAVDSTSFVSDSRAFRKAIFEILVGKSFQDLYLSIARLKEVDKKRIGAANTLEVFKQFINEVRPHQEDLNLVHLQKRISELKSQIDRALTHRDSLAKLPPRRSAVDTTSRKHELLSVEMASMAVGRKQNEVLSELGRLERLKAETILDVTQIKKMIFSHDKLNLFSINSCPYCLRDVERALNRCVCGAVVDEVKYEKFFYNADEYLTILKSKQKNVDTIESAIESCREEYLDGEKQLTHLAERAAALKADIASVVEKADAIVDVAQFDEMDRLIVSLRGELGSLEQQRELERKREELEKSFQSIDARHASALSEYNALQAKADLEMIQRREEFSAKFSDLMRQSVPRCRTANIDSDYMPVLNGGEYREASAEVPKRLSYFLTLLYLSLQDSEVGFPRFLLIDTPETAGIDSENLIANLTEVQKIVYSHSPPDCQVILTTGIGKYPPGCEGLVFETLTENSRLLKPRQQELPLDSSNSPF